ncbi:unnamed protein product [Gordionus sp. m RMFG-2023]|uniref:uncharacterized protein LOC135928236 n=1 Tax=Gordionus sp. m RMFG-2023 TaxID=3053472 RepID=UPI0030E43764
MESSHPVAFIMMESLEESPTFDYVKFSRDTNVAPASNSYRLIKSWVLDKNKFSRNKSIKLDGKSRSCDDNITPLNCAAPVDTRKITALVQTGIKKKSKSNRSKSKNEVNVNIGVATTPDNKNSREIVNSPYDASNDISDDVMTLGDSFKKIDVDRRMNKPYLLRHNSEHSEFLDKTLPIDASNPAVARNKKSHSLPFQSVNHDLESNDNSFDTSGQLSAIRNKEITPSNIEWKNYNHMLTKGDINGLSLLMDKQNYKRIIDELRTRLEKKMTDDKQAEHDHLYEHWKQNKGHDPFEPEINYKPDVNNNNNNNFGEKYLFNAYEKMPHESEKSIYNTDILNDVFESGTRGITNENISMVPYPSSYMPRPILFYQPDLYKTPNMANIAINNNYATNDDVINFNNHLPLPSIPAIDLKDPPKINDSILPVSKFSQSNDVIDASKQRDISTKNNEDRCLATDSVNNPNRILDSAYSQYKSRNFFSANTNLIGQTSSAFIISGFQVLPDTNIETLESIWTNWSGAVLLNNISPKTFKLREMLLFRNIQKCRNNQQILQDMTEEEKTADTIKPVHSFVTSNEPSTESTHSMVPLNVDDPFQDSIFDALHLSQSIIDFYKKSQCAPVSNLSFDIHRPEPRRSEVGGIKEDLLHKQDIVFSYVFVAHFENLISKMVSALNFIEDFKFKTCKGSISLYKTVSQFQETFERS